MADLKNITVNGVPLERVIEEAQREEIRSHHQDEVNGMAFVVSMSRSNNSFRLRNHSGTRSGRGRVIYSAGGAA